MDKFFSAIIFFMLLNNLFLLASPGITWLIRFTAFQGVILASLLFGLQHSILAIAVLCIKGIILPSLLMRTYNKLHLARTITQRLNLGIAVSLGMLGLIFSLWLDTRLPLLPALFPALLFPTAITTLFCGLILLVGRRSAISQVIGYLVAENGIFLLGVPLMAAGAIWFELALLLDIFVAVFVMGIAISHIGKTFESMDTSVFRKKQNKKYNGWQNKLWPFKLQCQC